MKSPDEVEECNFWIVIDFVVTKRIDSCCSKEEIRAATFEELKEEDTAATQIAWLGEKQSVRHD